MTSKLARCGHIIWDADFGGDRCPRCQLEDTNHLRSEEGWDQADPPLLDEPMDVLDFMEENSGY